MFRLSLRAACLTAGLLLAAGLLVAQVDKDRAKTEAPPPPDKDRAKTDKDKTKTDKDKTKTEPPGLSDKELQAILDRVNRDLNPGELQRLMAQSDDEVLRRTRLHRIAFDRKAGDEGKQDVQLTIEGITLKGDRGPGESASPTVPKDLESKLEKLFLVTYTKRLTNTILLTPDGKLRAKLRPLQETFTALDDARHPTRLLQQMTREDNKTALDGTLFADATFNAQGQLVLDGLLGDAPAKTLPGVQKLFDDLKKMNVEKRPAWLMLPEWARKQSATLEPVKLNLHPWDDKDPAAVGFLQRRLAENKGADAELCHHTRVLGVHFAYGSDNRGNWERRCFFKAETILPGYVKGEPGKPSADDVKLLGVLEGTCKPAWKAVVEKKDFASKDDLRMKFAFEPVYPRVIKSGLTELQNALLADPSLDGTLIDKVTFDSAGNFLVTGFVNTKEDADKVKALATKVLKELAKK